MATELEGKSEGTVSHRQALEANLKKIEGLTQRLVAAMAGKRHVPAALQGPGQELYMKAAAAWMARGWMP